jgi:hypothetical protein
MNLFLRIASLIVLLSGASVATSANFTGDVTGGGVFSDNVSTADGWQMNNASANGVDFWTLTIAGPSNLSVNIDSNIDFGISVYQGAVSDALGFAFDNAASFEDPISFEFGSFVAGTPSFGFAGSSLAGILLETAGIYTIAVGGADFGFAGPYQYDMNVNVSSVPVPAAVWLFASGLIGLIGRTRRQPTV